jgi:hypothetical protein
MVLILVEVWESVEEFNKCFSIRTQKLFSKNLAFFTLSSDFLYLASISDSDVLKPLQFWDHLNL